MNEIIIIIVIIFQLIISTSTLSFNHYNAYHYNIKSFLNKKHNFILSPLLLSNTNSNTYSDTYSDSINNETSNIRKEKENQDKEFVEQFIIDNNELVDREKEDIVYGDKFEDDMFQSVRKKKGKKQRRKEKKPTRTPWTYEEDDIVREQYKLHKGNRSIFDMIRNDSKLISLGYNRSAKDIEKRITELKLHINGHNGENIDNDDDNSSNNDDDGKEGANDKNNVLEGSYIEKATLYDQKDIFIYKRPRYSSYTIIDIDEDILMEEDINDEETKFFRSRKKRNEMIQQTSLDIGWKPCAGIIADIKRRWSKESYISDWKDGIIKGNKKKTLSAILFLYFACLAPTVAFGGLTNLITEGKMGVLEFIISCGSSGIVYSLFSGQPMTFLGPTGLTLAFIAALYRFTAVLNIPFLGMYAWTGLWTSLFIALSAFFNLSNLLKLCTRFTDDCFNALLSLNFLYEASLSVLRNFYKPEADLAAAFAATNIALGTWQSTTVVVKLRNSKLFNSSIRKNISNFGPTFVILAISFFTSRLTGINIEKLSVPSVFGLAEGRSWLVDLFVVPTWLRIAAVGPAILLTMLFYLDQNISVRAVNSCEVKKGDAYHLDLLVLSGIVGVLSVLGLPWTCAATVQSMNHVNAMSEFEKDEEGLERRKNIIETRVTGLAIHSCILGSIFLLPLLAQIPLPVVSGIFFYFGNKLTQGNLLLTRLAHIFTEKKLLRKENIYNNLPHSTVYKFIGLQAFMLGLVWTLKQSKKFALFFPSCIALLMVTRSFLLPKLFKESELSQLDPLM